MKKWPLPPPGHLAIVGPISINLLFFKYFQSRDLALHACQPKLCPNLSFFVYKANYQFCLAENLVVSLGKFHLSLSSFFLGVLKESSVVHKIAKLAIFDVKIPGYQELVDTDELLLL